MNPEDESYTEELGYYNTDTAEGLMKSLSYDILNNIIEKYDGDVDSFNILLDENMSPAELLKHIEELIGDGFSFEAVAVHVRERLIRKINGEEDVFDGRISQDNLGEMLIKQLESEIVEYLNR